MKRKGSRVEITVLRFCIMNNKKRILILLKILDQIKQDNEKSREFILGQMITLNFFVCNHI